MRHGNIFLVKGFLDNQPIVVFSLIPCPPKDVKLHAYFYINRGLKLDMNLIVKGVKEKKRKKQTHSVINPNII